MPHLSRRPAPAAISRATPWSTIKGFVGTERMASALLCALLGLFLLYGAALAPMPALHDAAHDSRHAFAFPCH